MMESATATEKSKSKRSSSATPATTRARDAKQDTKAVVARARKQKQDVASGTPDMDAGASDVTMMTAEAVQADASGADAPALRKKELIEAVVVRSGMKKKAVKPVVEGVLDVLGDALGADRALNLPPFGKLRIHKVRRRGNARVAVARLRRPVVEAEAAMVES